MDQEDRQIRVSGLVREILEKHRSGSGVSRHQVLVAVNRKFGLHVDHQNMVDSTLAVLGTKTRKDRYVLKKLK